MLTKSQTTMALTESQRLSAMGAAKPQALHLIHCHINRQNESGFFGGDRQG
jgi:hypothetical protein